MTIRCYKDISPTIGQHVFIDQSAVVIGDVVIGEDCSIWPTTVVRGDVNKIRIGACTNIQDGSVLHVTHPNNDLPEGFALHVGENVTVGHRVVLHGCTVEDNCLIGMSSTIMDGAVIHSGAFIGAGSLVPQGKELEGGYLWLGTPVKKVRMLNDKELDWIDYSAKHYVALKNHYLTK